MSGCFLCDEAQECRTRCQEECDGDRKCYVDQNEVKICAFDIMNYPDRTRPSANISHHYSEAALSPIAELATAARCRQQAPPDSLNRRQQQQRLRPQSETWTEGLLRRSQEIAEDFMTGAKMRLTPKASSFQTGRDSERGQLGGGHSSSAPLSFEQQMLAARMENGRR